MTNENTLWMGDLEPWMNELFIMNSFIVCGFKPKSIKIINDKSILNHKRFCFVNFNSYQEANEALFKLNSKLIPNTNILFRLNIAKYNTNSKKYKNYKNVYVGNLPLKITDTDLFNLFKSKYPSVYYASIITQNGVSRGYGFVHFSKEDEYKKCLKEMNGIFIDNRIIRVKEKNHNEDKPKKNNYIKKHLIKKITEENCFVDKKKNEFHNIENDIEQISCESSNSLENKNFAKNIDLLESDDTEELYEKIKGSVDKMYEYYKSFQKLDEISSLILYYTSNSKNCK